MDESIYITVRGAIAVICWLIVAGGSGLAVFARCIHDTTLERLGLSCVSIAAVGTACRIIASGWASDGQVVLAASLALYVGAVMFKHIRGQG